MLPQQYCLKWKYHNTNIQFTFSQLLEKGSFCDVTLWCGGCAFRAHRAVLASCSGLLALLLDSHEATGGEPALVLDRTEPHHLRQLLAFMYTGEVSVHHTELAGLLKTAEELKIKGLADVSWKDSNAPTNNTPNNASNNASNNAPSNASNIASHIEPPLNYAIGPLQSNIASNITAVAAAITAKNNVPPPIGLPSVAPAITKAETITSSVGTDPLIADVEEVHPVQPIMLAVNGSLILPPLNVAQTPPPVEAIKRRRGRPPLEPKMSQDSEILTVEHSSPKKIKIDPPQIAITKKLPEESLMKELPIEWVRPPADGIEDPEELSSEYSEASLDGRDISQFLDTVMEVDGVAPSSPQTPVTHSSPQNSNQFKGDPLALTTSSPLDKPVVAETPATPGPATTGGTLAQFADVVKLSDYLVRGRRPQFWAEDYVKRVMEAVFCKELEMKQAAEMLGVSYGTLYGRYRDCFGCINRPYRVQDFWTEQGRAEILIKLQMKDITLFKAAEMLNVTPQTLSSYLNTIDPNASIKEEASTSPQSHEDSEANNGKTDKPQSDTDKYETDVHSDDNEDDEEDASSGKDECLIDSPMLNQSVDPDAKSIAGDPKSIMQKPPGIRVVNMKFLKGDSADDVVTVSDPLAVSQLLKNHPDLTMTAAATNKRKVHFQEETDIINPTSSNGDNDDDEEDDDVEDIEEVEDSSASS